MKAKTPLDIDIVVPWVNSSDPEWIKATVGIDALMSILPEKSEFEI